MDWGQHISWEFLPKPPRHLVSFAGIWPFTPELRVRLVTLNMFKLSSNLLTDSSKAVLLLCVLFCYLCLFVFVVPSCLFIAALWSPAGQGQTSKLSRVWCFLVFLSLSHMVSRARCGAWLYLFLIFAFFILHLRLKRTLHAKLCFGINFIQHSFGALARNFRLTKFRKFRGWQPTGPAGDGETKRVRKCCLMSLSWYHLRLVEIGPLCFVFLQWFLLTIPRRCFFFGSFLLFMLHVCHLGSLQPCDHLLQAGPQTGREAGTLNGRKIFHCKKYQDARSFFLRHACNI